MGLCCRAAEHDALQDAGLPLAMTSALGKASRQAWKGSASVAAGWVAADADAASTGLSGAFLGPCPDRRARDTGPAGSRGVPKGTPGDFRHRCGTDDATDPHRDRAVSGPTMRRHVRAAPAPARRAGPSRGVLPAVEGPAEAMPPVEECGSYDREHTAGKAPRTPGGSWGSWQSWGSWCLRGSQEFPGFPGSPGMLCSPWRMRGNPLQRPSKEHPGPERMTGSALGFRSTPGACSEGSPWGTSPRVPSSGSWRAGRPFGAGGSLPAPPILAPRERSTLRRRPTDDCIRGRYPTGAGNCRGPRDRSGGRDPGTHAVARSVDPGSLPGRRSLVAGARR